MKFHLKTSILWKSQQQQQNHGFIINFCIIILCHCWLFKSSFACLLCMGNPLSAVIRSPASRTFKNVLCCTTSLSLALPPHALETNEIIHWVLLHTTLWRCYGAHSPIWKWWVPLLSFSFAPQMQHFLRLGFLDFLAIATDECAEK